LAATVRHLTSIWPPQVRHGSPVFTTNPPKSANSSIHSVTVPAIFDKIQQYPPLVLSHATF